MGEKQKRQYLAGEALLLGYGGISLRNRITGKSINAIRRWIEELQQEDVYGCKGPERAQGAGRPKLTDREFFALPIQYLNELGKRNYVIKALAD